MKQIMQFFLEGESLTLKYSEIITVNVVTL